jgi:hypothetical protein
MSMVPILHLASSISNALLFVLDSLGVLAAELVERGRYIRHIGLRDFVVVILGEGEGRASQGQGQRQSNGFRHKRSPVFELGQYSSRGRRARMRGKILTRSRE